jgi:hypothetical protein
MFSRRDDVERQRSPPREPGTTPHHPWHEAACSRPHTCKQDYSVFKSPAPHQHTVAVLLPAPPPALMHGDRDTAPPYPVHGTGTASERCQGRPPAVLDREIFLLLPRCLPRHPSAASDTWVRFRTAPHVAESTLGYICLTPRVCWPCARTLFQCIQYIFF